MKTPVTLLQCKLALGMQAIPFLVLVGAAAAEIHEKKFWLATLPLFGFLGQALIIPAIWKQHQAVKNGTIIFQERRPLPQIVSIIAVLIFTLFVGLCSAFIIYITYTHFNTQKGWTVCAMSVLSVLAFIGYCWYRVVTEKPAVRLEVTQEQPKEGVWPPPPATPNQD